MDMVSSDRARPLCYSNKIKIASFKNKPDSIEVFIKEANPEAVQEISYYSFPLSGLKGFCPRALVTKAVVALRRIVNLPNGRAHHQPFSYIIHRLKAAPRIPLVQSRIGGSLSLSSFRGQIEQ